MDVKIKTRGKNDGKINCKSGYATNIKKLREVCGMNQEQLAEKTGMAIKRIRKYEYGQITPTLDDMENICEALEVSILALFLETKLNEVHCDKQTGLTANTIEWLSRLNRNKHSFIQILNKISNNKYLFTMIYDIMRSVLEGMISMKKQETKVASS